MIARRIREMMGSGYIYDKDSDSFRKIQYKDIVILTRSIQGWAEIFSAVLAEEGIPAYSVSREGYFETYEIKNQMQKRKTAAERFQKRSEKSWQSLRGRSDTSEAYFPILRSMICWQRSLKRQDTGLLLLRCREESSGSQMWRC